MISFEVIKYIYLSWYFERR